MRDIFLKPLSCATVGVNCRQQVDENRRKFGLFLLALVTHSFIHVFIEQIVPEPL